jgi:L-amino acid N-acyltransferase YncA
LQRPDADAILTWRYPQPYDFYNISSDSTESFFNPASPHFSVFDADGVLIGFLSIGIESQVPGGDYSEPAVDIGIGLRPDQTGRGLGRIVIQQFIDEIIAPGDFPPLLRATIAAFNQRSLKTFRSLGFRETGTFTTRVGNRNIEWIIVTRCTLTPTQ